MKPTHRRTRHRRTRTVLVTASAAAWLVSTAPSLAGAQVVPVTEAISRTGTVFNVAPGSEAISRAGTVFNVAPGNEAISRAGTVFNVAPGTEAISRAGTVFNATCLSCDAGGPYVSDDGSVILYGTGSAAWCGQTIESYDWDFGDGHTGTGAATTHTYTAIGDYTVTLCLTDSDARQRCCETLAMITVPQGACCLDDGSACAETDATSCAQAGGVYLGDDTSCPTVNTAVVNEPGGQVFVHVIGPPVSCTLDPPGSYPGPHVADPWTSSSTAQTCNQFGVPGSPAIPADFFEPGSEPFAGEACLRGVPLGDPNFGDADTIIERLQDPFDRCELPSASPVTVGIRIAELSLASVEPITVMVLGQPTLWDVDVDLSEVEPPMGTVTATKTHCNGGTYDSSLNVQARFAFTKVGDPSQVRVLDTGLEGIPPLALVATEPNEWASDLGELYAAHADSSSDFHAGFATPGPLTSCDCNANNRWDQCDIEEGLASDCNANAVPDSCDIASGLSPDSNQNGVPDECEPEPTGAGDAAAAPPKQFALYPSHPNPFNPATTIEYDVPYKAVVSLKIYDVLGRTVRRLQPVVAVEPGHHVVRWDGRDEQGRSVSSGVYYYRLEAGNWTDSRAMVVVK